jgi:hypothetical protein
LDVIHNWERKARAGQSGQVGLTGLHGPVSLGWTDGTGRPGHDSGDRKRGKGWKMNISAKSLGSRKKLKKLLAKTNISVK